MKGRVALAGANLVSALALGGTGFAAPLATAEQVLKASRAATSIGPDPCRNPGGEEIVVCGRRESPYALPLYNPAGRPEALSGRAREAAVATAQDTSAGCHLRGETCTKPLPFLSTGIPSGKVKLLIRKAE
jgi:hypothetical protein